MPSIAPSNFRVFNLQLGELKVQWDPIPPQAANGRLLGYRISYVESYWIKYVNITDLNTNMVVLRGLKLAQRYRISVAAFTSKGVGPQSSLIYVTTSTRCGNHDDIDFFVIEEAIAKKRTKIYGCLDSGFYIVFTKLFLGGLMLINTIQIDFKMSIVF